MADSLDRDIEAQIESLGFELVDIERAGSRARPILRLRIDRPDSEPGRGVTLDECARVSRAVEARLDADEAVAERYTLEVSSPGIERPLVRERDFRRFAGRHVALLGNEPLAGRARRLEGELLGMEQDRVRLRLGDGEELDIPRAEIARAHLTFRWDEER
jgi:ribosome maturation factor RimP